MDAEFVDAGALACTRYAADANAYALSAVRQAFLDDLLRDGLMFGVCALDERHSLSEDGYIAFDDAFDVVDIDERP